MIWGWNHPHGQGQFKDELCLNASKQRSIYSALLGRSSGYLGSCCLYGIFNQSVTSDPWHLQGFFFPTQLLLTHRSTCLYASSTVHMIGWSAFCVAKQLNVFFQFGGLEEETASSSGYILDRLSLSFPLPSLPLSYVWTCNSFCACLINEGPCEVQKQNTQEGWMDTSRKKKKKQHRRLCSMHSFQRLLRQIFFYCRPSTYTAAALLKWAFSSTVADILSADPCTRLSDIDFCSFSLSGSSLLHTLVEVA